VTVEVDAVLLCENISIKLRWRGDDIGDFVGVDLEGVDDDFRGDLDLTTFNFGECERDGVKGLAEDPCCFEGVKTNSLEGDEAGMVISCLSGVKVTRSDLTGVKTPPVPTLFGNQPPLSDAAEDSLAATELSSGSSLLPFLSTTSAFSSDAAVTGTTSTE